MSRGDKVGSGTGCPSGRSASFSLVVRMRRFKQHVQLLISFSERQHRVILQHLRKERCQRNASKRRRHSREQPPSQAEQSLAAVVCITTCPSAAGLSKATLGLFRSRCLTCFCS